MRVEQKGQDERSNVGLALQHPSLSPSPGQRRQQDGDQQCDDRHDHEKLNQSKGMSPSKCWHLYLIYEICSFRLQTVRRPLVISTTLAHLPSCIQKETGTVLRLTRFPVISSNSSHYGRRLLFQPSPCVRESCHRAHRSSRRARRHKR